MTAHASPNPGLTVSAAASAAGAAVCTARLPSCRPAAAAVSVQGVAGAQAPPAPPGVGVCAKALDAIPRSAQTSVKTMRVRVSMETDLR